MRIKRRHKILGAVTVAGGLVALRMSWVDGSGTWGSTLPFAIGLTGLGLFVFMKKTGPILPWVGAIASGVVCAGAYAICKEYGPCGR